QRIQELMDRDRALLGEAVGEIVTLEHPSDRVRSRQFHDSGRAELGGPGGVEKDLGPVAMQNLEYLLLVCLRVLGDLLGTAWRARGVAPGGIADHAGEVPDDEHHLASKFLVPSHLV